MKKKSLHFLILAATAQKHLETAIDEAGHTWDRIEPRELSMYISDEKGKDQIWHKGEPIPPKTYDAVIPRLGKDRAHGARLLRHLSENLAAFTLQTGRAVDLCADKFRTAQLLAGKGIKVPRQFLCKSIEEDFDQIIDQLGGWPVICKPVGGSQGRGVIPLESPLSASHILEYLLAEGKNIVIQQFIETRTKKAGGTDLRLIVCNGKVISTMKRTAPSGKVRANLAKDATGEKFEPNKNIKKLAVDAVKAVEGLTFAGVDIMVEHNTGTAFVVELNGNPGTKIINVVKYNHFIDLVAYVEKEAPQYRSYWETQKEAERQKQAEKIENTELVQRAYNELIQIAKLPKNQRAPIRLQIFEQYGINIYDRARSMLPTP